MSVPASAPSGTGVREDVWIPTTCEMCYNSCAIQVHRVDGVVVKIEGIPGAPPNYGTMCAKGHAGIMSLYSAGRITQPLRRRNPEKGRNVDPEWETISWDEAKAILVRELKRVHQEDPRKLIVATFDTKAHMAVRLFVAAFGTPNWHGGPSGYFCGRGVHPVAYAFTGNFDLHPDFKYAKFVVMFGASNGFISNTHGMAMAKELAEARERGLKLVVVDPQLTNAASQADEWVPIRPGTDAALALGMMHVMVHELDLYDREFVKRSSNGPYLIGEDGLYFRHPVSKKPLVWDSQAGAALEYDQAEPGAVALAGQFSVEGRTCRPGFAALVDKLREYTPDWVAEITTVPAATVRRLGQEYASAAEIGSTIFLEGDEYPYRPACATWYRGATAHKHGMLFGMTLAMLNALVGAIDVPGGLVNHIGAGPFGFPKAGEDGMVIPAQTRDRRQTTYPPRPVRAPETAELQELFPVSVYARAMLWLGILQREKFQLPYEPDTMILCRTNLVANSGDPAIMEAALEKLRFFAAFADHHDETTIFADLVLPDTHYLERLSPFGAYPLNHQASPISGGNWSVNIQQPVVTPLGESRHWMEVLFDLADAVGFRRELYTVLNAATPFEGENRLDLERQYTWEEICDRWAKVWTGSQEHGLEYLKQHGYHVLRPRLARETYPRPFHNGRVPFYLEHHIWAGQQVKAVTDELGISDWDTSDYQAVVEWKPCPAYDRHQNPEFDLYAVNAKLPFMTFSFTAENRWLVEVAQRNGRVYPVSLNRETARKKGLAEGDRVRLETPDGHSAEGILHLTEGLHPECLSIPGVLGRWVVTNPAARGQGVHFNSLIDYTFNRMDTVSAALDACVRLKITKA